MLRYSPYPNVTIAMPGRHALQTKPVGGDFVVMVNDPALTYNGRDPEGEHQFKHDDIFKDIEHKRNVQMNPAIAFMGDYLEVIKGGEPLIGTWYTNMTLMHPFEGNGVNHVTFLQAVQCLAVAEHRRYAQYEPQFGGRFLPFRFAAGIAEGLWTAEDASAVQKKGRPGVEYLEKIHGVPDLTKELMK